MFADLLRSMLHLLTGALGRGDQFGPDALPVVGEHRLASHSAAGEALNGCTVLNRDRSFTGCDLVHKRWDHAQVTSQSK